MSLPENNIGADGLYDSPFFHLEERMTIVDLKTCAQCRQGTSLKPATLLCTACKSCFYCSKDCQAKHWSSHKNHCKEIKKALAKYHQEEEKLHHMVSDFSFGDDETPIDYLDPINDRVGQFWGYHETRPFCRSLGALIQVYVEPKSDTPLLTKQSIRQGILYGLRLLYYNRGDNMGYRDWIPALFLQLGQDQLAFDFISWYCLYPDDRYDWGNPRLPYLHYWNRDRYEDILSGNGRDSSLSHMMIYGLIKIRNYLHLMDVDALYTLITAANYDYSKRECSITPSPLTKLQGQTDIFRLIKSFVIDPSAAIARKHRETTPFHQLKADAYQQIEKTLRIGESEINPRIWKSIVNPKPLLTQISPSSYAHKSAEECYFSLKTALPAWLLDPRALSFLTTYVKQHGGIKYDANMKSEY